VAFRRVRCEQKFSFVRAEDGTFIYGGCPAPGTPPPPYTQLGAAVAYLQANAGKVSPVTLDIGVNDVEPDVTIAPNDCTVSSNFDTDLATLDNNLTETILPQLQAALTVNGRVTGSIVMMNYYDAFQNICQGPASAQFVQDFNTFNTHLANDVSQFGIIVDVFSAFGGATTPNPNLCASHLPYTWVCGPPPGPDIHPTDLGYSVIADTFAAAIPTD
jgi:lysophospholipase L1-like esterase